MDMTDRGLLFAKPEPRKKAKERTIQVYADFVGRIRAFVFGRERGICRCCRKRLAESMHELESKGAGGKVSKRNSIAVCGLLVHASPSCHTYLQQNKIGWSGGPRRAQGTLLFWPKTQRAADWLGVKRHERIESPVMREIAESV
jgi:hypothetical protein